MGQAGARVMAWRAPYPPSACLRSHCEHLSHEQLAASGPAPLRSASDRAAQRPPYQRRRVPGLPTTRSKCFPHAAMTPTDACCTSSAIHVATGTSRQISRLSAAAWSPSPAPLPPLTS